MPEIWQETRKNKFWQKLHFVKNNCICLQNPKNRQIDRFTCLAISLTIFELQRRIIPHFNPLKKSFWPFEMHFHPRSYRFSDILQNMCPILFAPDFSTFLCVREGKKTFPRVLRIHKNEKKNFGKKTWLHGDLNLDWQDQSQLCLPPNHRETVLKRPQFLKDTNYEIYWKKRKFSKKLLTNYFEIQILNFFL